jgi:hypothetical protein
VQYNTAWTELHVTTAPGCHTWGPRTTQGRWYRPYWIGLDPPPEEAKQHTNPSRHEEGLERSLADLAFYGPVQILKALAPLLIDLGPRCLHSLPDLRPYILHSLLDLRPYILCSLLNLGSSRLHSLLDLRPYILHLRA